MVQDKRRQKIIIYTVGFLFLCNCLAWFAVWEISQPPLFEVVFFDVGQGDSALIKTAEGHQILIDGGPNDKVLEKLGGEMPFWDKTLDLVVLSHPEQDHMAGLLAVLENYKVSYILWTGVVRDTALFKEWQKALAKEQAQDRAVVKLASAGQKIVISPKSQIEILYPFENMAGKIMKDSNGSSIVCRLIYNKSSFLFTGDIGQPQEYEIVEKECGLL
ncbi:MAG: MBL fold metallo-hydrolase, partial [Patescibacteria group bacterium]